MNETNKIDLIDDLTATPKYQSSTRSKKAITEEVVERLNQFLKENETKQITGMSKQQMKITDMHEVLLEEGYNLSYSR